MTHKSKKKEKRKRRNANVSHTVRLTLDGHLAREHRRKLAHVWSPGLQSICTLIVFFILSQNNLRPLISGGDQIASHDE